MSKHTAIRYIFLVFIVLFVAANVAHADNPATKQEAIAIIENSLPKDILPIFQKMLKQAKSVEFRNDEGSKSLVIDQVFRSNPQKKFNEPEIKVGLRFFWSFLGVIENRKFEYDTSSVKYGASSFVVINAFYSSKQQWTRIGFGVKGEGINYFDLCDVEDLFKDARAGRPVREFDGTFENKMDSDGKWIEIDAIFSLCSTLEGMKIPIVVFTRNEGTNLFINGEKDVILSLSDAERQWCADIIRIANALYKLSQKK